MKNTEDHSDISGMWVTLIAPVAMPGQTSSCLLDMLTSQRSTQSSYTEPSDQKKQKHYIQFLS